MDYLLLKPTKRKMNKFLLILFPISAYAQPDGCLEQTSNVISVHYLTTKNTSGFGFELGQWIGPEDGKFSWFFGGTLTNTKNIEKDGKTQETGGAIFYAKGMYTVKEYPKIVYFYAVSVVGVQDFERPIFEVGARVATRLARNVVFAVEPLYDFKRINWYGRLCFSMD